MRSASVKSLLQVKDITPEMAVQIRAIWKAENKAALAAVYPDLAIVEQGFFHAPKLTHAKRLCIDKLIGTSGVEHLGYCNRANRHIYYCNAGDTYTTTVCFVGESLTVGDMGYYVERGTLATEERF